MMNRITLAVCMAALVTVQPKAQTETGQVRFDVCSGSDAISEATVAVGALTFMTDEHGKVLVTLPIGQLSATVTAPGFSPLTITIEVVAGAQQVELILEPQTALEEELTVIASTRSNRLIEDQPLRVEALNREEIEEKMLMTPGDIVMLLNEMGGLRVQATSPALGAASVRIQGMRGRYTRLLSDGLPIHGSQTGGLGLLQIPPMDLGQVEVIKGVASALYGAGAMGGVVNLLSRRPREAPEREILINRSTAGGTDGILWLSGPLTPRWGATLLAGGHTQELNDIDGDGWADLPSYDRFVVRPRFFWDDSRGQSLFVTSGATVEDRAGGSLPGMFVANGTNYRESLGTKRLDLGTLWQRPVAGRYLLSARATVASQIHDRRFGTIQERDRLRTTFGEVTLRGTRGAHTWVGGFAVEQEDYAPVDVRPFAYTFTTPGFFAQNEVSLRSWLAVSLSGRVDRHSRYGWFFSPRASALLRSGSWSTRVSAGRGFFGPSVLTEETGAAGLTRLSLERALKAERGRSTSLDVTYEPGTVSYGLTIFGSHITSPVQVNRSTYTIRNLTAPTTNIGVELLATFRRAPVALTSSYTYVRTREQVGNVTTEVALTPRHSAGWIAMVENPDGRLGVELYFTGRQRLEINPYRDKSQPYFIVGILLERRVGPIRLFLNGENLTDVRQSRWHPLILPNRSIDGRWTVDAWAPVDGRIFNGGIRIQF